MSFFQKRLFLAVLMLIIFMGAAFSEIKASQDLSFSPYIDSRVGFLLFDEGNSSYFHTESVGVNLKTDHGHVKIDGSYLKGKSENNELLGNLSFASVNFEISRKFYTVRTCFSSFSVPDELKILGGKPRFSLKNGNGNSVNLGTDLDFYIFENDFRLSANLILGNASFEEGDLYYFYGKPDDFSFLGGKIKFSLPLGFDILTFGGNLHCNIDTNSEEKVGNSTLSLNAIFLAKEFLFDFADKFSIKPFLGFSSLSFSGTTLVTSENQRYFLFPYKFIGGSIDEDFRFLSLGNSFEFKKGGFQFYIDFIYFFCFQNSASGNYSYKYKKNIFFDGSSNSEELDLPNVAGTHIFAGIAEASYKFSVHKNFSPTLKLTKMLATVILNDETKDFFDTTFSSYSTVSNPSNTHANEDSSETWQNFKRALLSGTSISLRIDF